MYEGIWQAIHQLRDEFPVYLSVFRNLGEVAEVKVVLGH